MGASRFSETRNTHGITWDKRYNNPYPASEGQTFDNRILEITWRA